MSRTPSRTKLTAVLNKIRKDDSQNASRWSSVVATPDGEIAAVQFMIELCLRRRGWIPIFCECLAGTPNLYQLSSTASALDAPAVHTVLRRFLETNLRGAISSSSSSSSSTTSTTTSDRELLAPEMCLVELVQVLLTGLSPPGKHVGAANSLILMSPVSKMDPISFVLYVVLPCLKPDHPNLHTALLLAEVATQPVHWKEYHAQSIVAEMLRRSLAEVESCVVE